MENRIKTTFSPYSLYSKIHGSKPGQIVHETLSQKTLTHTKKNGLEVKASSNLR
jgi:hypothetical protein